VRPARSGSCEPHERSGAAWPTVAIWILSLIGLEIQHFKWIVWEHWDCRRHGVKNKDCRCKDRMILYL
jgi:hypothetical protein